jgi:hypothetical protein
MDLTITSYESVGPIRFGMTRKEVRELLDSPVIAFKRNDDDVAETDGFDDLGIYVEYDAKDHCVAVEMARPSNPIFADTELLALPYAAVKTWVRKQDEDVEVDESGFDSPGLGIGMYADIKKGDKKSTAETVIAFSRSYYGDE